MLNRNVGIVRRGGDQSLAARQRLVSAPELAQQSDRRDRRVAIGRIERGRGVERGERFAELAEGMVTDAAEEVRGLIIRGERAGGAKLRERRDGLVRSDQPPARGDERHARRARQGVRADQRANVAAPLTFPNGPWLTLYANPACEALAP